MTDRRLLWSNGRVAHRSLQGQVQAQTFTDGQWLRVNTCVTPLMDDVTPGTWRRERELVLHDRFCALEFGKGWVFGFAERDGYAGYLHDGVLGVDTGPMTHVVSARQSYLTSVPELKNKYPPDPISFGTEFCVFNTFEEGRWSEVGQLRPEPEDHKTEFTVFIPSAHLRPLDQPETDLVTVAERFLGTPYHWGGNSGFGIDCSGLVQASCLACDMPCPGDSDLQEAALGQTLPPGAPHKRGDLLFWNGHVALVADPETLIHANAFHMAVAYEPIKQAITRIEAQGDGPVTRHARLD